MAYKLTVYETIDNVDVDEWNTLRRGAQDPFHDPRFIRAIERSMAGTGRFRHLVFRDADGNAVATVCACTYRVNAALLADGWSKKLAGALGRVVPPLLNFNVVFCGLSYSAGQNHLRISADADKAEVLKTLDDFLLQFAREEKARAIVFKEFTAEECDQLGELDDLGYRRADSLPMNCVSPEFSDFEDYLTNLKSRKRYPIRQSQKKFANTDLRVVQMSGRDGAADVITDEVHELYEAVFHRAAVKLEKLPPDVFREIARHLPDESAFTFIYEAERVVAFAVSIHTDENFHQMFVGVDYELNPKCDLYFNLFFHAMDFGYRQDVNQMFVGQSADVFKRRKLGCFHVPLYFYVKGADPISGFVVRTWFHALFPPHPCLPENGTESVD